MKIYEGKDENGNLTYFEVPNLFLSRSCAINIVNSIPNAVILSKNMRNDVFCTFRVGNRVFEIMEPFRDNSRYQISEKVINASVELETIKYYFSAYKQWPFSLLSR